MNDVSALVSLQDRQLGMLYGLHAGDALGATLEFCEPNDHPDSHREILGGGHFNWLPGAATDDTDLMLCVLHELSEGNGINIDSLACRFIEWLSAGPVDVGTTTRSAILRMKAGVPSRSSGARGEHSQGNGSLMRCAPLALLECDERSMAMVIAQQASMTHAHHICIYSDYLLVMAIRDAFCGVLKGAIYLNTLERARSRSAEIYERLKVLPGISWSDLSCTGYVIDTLCAAFWALMHTDSFEESLIRVVNRGMDADTCGAVTGALSGAYYGQASIPSKWLDKLEKADEIRLLYFSVRSRQCGRPDKA